MFIGKYNKSLILTYIGAACAVVGMHFALIHNLKYAMICIVLAGVCDLFDGKVARMCKRTEEEKLFGIEIDSLADMVGFVVFPVVIGYSLGLTEWYYILGYVLLVLAGITRLGFFNISVSDTNRDTPIKKYSGLPVTSTSFIVPLLYVISILFKNIEFATMYPYMTYIVAFLFVLNFKLPKPKGKAYIVIAIIALLGLIGLFLIK